MIGVAKLNGMRNHASGPPLTSWDFSNLLDSSGNALHLTLSGQAPPSISSNPWSIGQNAIVLDGTQSLTAFGTGYSIANADHTIEIRFKRNTSLNGTTQVLLGRWKGEADFQYLLYIDASNKLTYIEVDASGNFISIASSSAITDGSAHAVAVVRSSNKISLYIDGTRVAGPAAITTTRSISSAVPFRIGDYEDGPLPWFGTIGDLRYSNNARWTGASYTVPTTPFVSDGNTLSLVKMDALKGTYLSLATYVGNCLLRSGHSQASGGWANPDGPLQALNGDWYFTASAYDGSVWTVWAVVASDVASLLAGTGTLQSSAIQTPTGGEGSLAGNGTVIAWNGTYYHYYQDGSENILYSTGSALNSAFSSGTAIFTAGAGGYSQYFDPWVRVSPDGTYLEMFFCGLSGATRVLLRSTSTDGTTWTAKTVVIADLSQFGYSADSPGEPSFSRLGSTYMFTEDGAATSGNRIVMRQVSTDGTNWLQLKKFIDSSGGSYLTVYDSSPYYDADNSRLVYLCTNSTSTNLAQPTDSDVGVWTAAINVG